MICRQFCWHTSSCNHLDKQTHLPAPHGLSKHKSMRSSQRAPVYPGAQVHLKLKSPKSSRTPSFLHGKVLQIPVFMIGFSIEQVFNSWFQNNISAHRLTLHLFSPVHCK